MANKSYKQSVEQKAHKKIITNADDLPLHEERKKELRSLSIDDILPQDIIESCILSFLIFIERNILLLNKRWKNLTECKMFKHLQKRIEILEVYCMDDKIYQYNIYIYI